MSGGGGQVAPTPLPGFEPQRRREEYDDHYDDYDDESPASDMFDRIDTNGDGKIDRAEFHAASLRFSHLEDQVDTSPSCSSCCRLLCCRRGENRRQLRPPQSTWRR